MKRSACLVLFVALMLLLIQPLRAAGLDISWTGLIDNKWSTPLNWSLGRLPLIGERVGIGGPLGLGGNYTIQLDVDVTIKGLEVGSGLLGGTQVLDLNGHTITLAQDVEVGSNGKLKISSGAVAGVADITVDSGGVIDWQGGTLGGSGQVNISVGGALNISGSSNKTLGDGKVINNAGTVTWTGSGNVEGQNGGVIHNSGTFEIQTTATLDYLGSGAVPIIDNTGTLKKSTAGTTICEFDLQNSSLVWVSSGTLVLNGGGSGDGQFKVDAPAELDFSAGAYTLNNGASFTGAGPAVLTAGGTVSLAGNVAATIFNITGGTLSSSVNGAMTISGSMSWQGGTMDGNGRVTFGNLSFLGISGAGPKGLINGWTLNNDGTVLWTGTGNIFGYNGGQINNAGVIDIQTAAGFDYQDAGAVPVINNTGSIQKSIDPGTTTVEFVFNNSAVVSAKAGVLQLNGGGASSGSFQVDPSITVVFGAGSPSLESGASFTGSGLGVVDGANLTLNGNSSADNFKLLSGSLTGTGTLTANSSFNWTGGIMSGPGTLKIAAPATLALAGSSAMRLANGWNLQNLGTVTWSGAGNLEGQNGGNIQNNGLFDVQVDASFAYVSGTLPAFVNGGTLKKSGAGGDTPMGFSYSGSGAVQVLSGHILFPSGGTFSDGTAVSGAVSLDGGTFVLAGSVNLGSNLQLTGGTINISPGGSSISGTLKWTGGFLDGGNTLTISPSGILELSGSGAKRLKNGFVLQNNGTINWLAGDWEGADGAVIDNSGTIDIQGDLKMKDLASGLTTFLDNTGTVQKSAGSGQADIGFDFDNHGSVEVDFGTLRLQAGGSSSGDFQIASGATLAWVSGTPELTAGASLSGLGLGLLDGATLTLTGLSTADNFEVRSGTLTGDGELDAQALAWSGGALSGPGKLKALAGLAISGAADKTFDGGWTLYNSLAGTWTGAGAIQGNTATFNNSGVLDIQTDASMALFGGATVPVIDSTGTIKKTTGTSTTIGFVVNEGGGSVEGLSGTLRLTAGGSLAAGLVAGGGATLELVSGNFAFGGGNIINGFGHVVADGATLTLNGPVSVTGNLDLTGGILTGASTLTVNSGAVLAWTGGEMSGIGTINVAALGQFNLSGAGDKSLHDGWAIQNNGNMTWAGAGNITGFNGATIQNNGTFEITNDQLFDFTGAGTQPTLNNAGTLLKSGASGTTTVEFAFSNSGIINVQVGQLSLAGTGAINNGSQFQGSGSVSLGSSFALNGNVQLDNAVLGSGTFTLNGDLGGVNMTLAGGVLKGTGTLSKQLIWTSGEMAGPGQLTVLSGATLTLTGAANKQLHGGFILHNNLSGLIVWQGAGDIWGYDGGSIENEGDFNVQNDQTLDFRDSGVRPTFVNTGHFSKSTATGVTVSEFTWSGAGTVDIGTGTFRLTQDGTLAGGYFVETGATIEFPSGAHSVTGGTEFDGSGQVLVNGATLSLDGDATLDGKLTFSAGTISGAHILTVNGLLTWTGGDLSGVATIEVVGGGELDINGSSALQFHDGFKIQNDENGTIRWSGGGDLSGFEGGTIENNGVFEIANDQTLAYGGAGGVPGLINTSTGTLRKTGGSGVTTVEITFENAGHVDIQSGSINFANGATLDNGATLGGAGAVQLSGGTFDFSANLTLQNVTLTGGTLFLNGDFDANNVVFAGGTIQGGGGLTGTLTWTGGDLVGPGAISVTGGADLFISGSADKILDGYALNVLPGGTIQWSGAGNLVGNNGASIQNDGLFDIQNDQMFHLGGAGLNSSLVNSGTLQKSGGSGVTTVEFNFENSATVDVQTGKITFANGATLDDHSTLTGAGALELAGGSFSFGNHLTLHNVTLTGGTVTLGGEFDGSNIEFAGGTVTGTGKLAGHLLWSGSDFFGPGELEVESGAQLDIGGAANKVYHDGFDLRNDNLGSIYWSGAGDLQGYNGGTIRNDGLFEIQNDQTFDFMHSGTRPLFQNNGLLRKAGGSGVTTMWLDFENHGQVDVQAGTLSFPNGAEMDGNSFLGGAGAVDLAGGSFDLSGNLTLQNVTLNNGTLSLSGALSANNLTLAGGTTTGSATVSGTLNWTDGDLSGAGELKISSSATLIISGAATKNFHGGYIIHNLPGGNVYWSGAGNLRGYDDGQIKNEGTFEIQNDQSFDYGDSGPVPQLLNLGTIRKTVASGVTTVEFSFENAATVDIQGGSLKLVNGATLDSNTFLGGNGSVELAAGGFLWNNNLTLKNVRVTGGTLALGGGFNADSVEFAGGVASGTGTILSGKLLWTGTDLAGPGQLTIPNGTELDLAGNGDKVFHDDFNFQIDNGGLVKWSDAGNFKGYNGGAIQNNGEFQFSNDQLLDFADTGTRPAFHNTGTLRKAGGSGVTTMEFAFDN
ncbi:MAG TPA: hypothetical protein VHH73_05355, partial [Verrucomicrobiae bacterium]|nr:hypothetical protein [Verrucomicrobiae bacterium]